MVENTSGSLMPHKDGFRGQISYKDRDGKRKFKTKVFKMPKRQAQKEFEEWRDSVIEELGQPNSGIILKDYIKKVLDYEEKFGTIEASTLSGYKSASKKINEHLGNLELCSITHQDIEQFMFELVDTHGLGNNSIKKTFNLLKRFLNQAVYEHLIPFNPANSVKPPRMKKPERYPLSKEEVKRLLNMLEGMDSTPLVLAAYFALYAGLRLGEVCALRWADIDFSHDDVIFINVRRAFGRTGNGGFYLKDPKCQSSYRTIPVADQSFIKRLKDKYSELKNICSHVGIPFPAEIYVLGDLDGTHRSPAVISKRFTSLMDSHNFKNTNNDRAKFHELRHTFATELIANGVDIEAAAALCGHSKASMTLDVYGHARPDNKLDGAYKLAQAYKKIMN